MNTGISKKSHSQMLVNFSNQLNSSSLIDFIFEVFFLLSSSFLFIFHQFHQINNNLRWEVIQKKIIISIIQIIAINEVLINSIVNHQFNVFVTNNSNNIIMTHIIYV